MSYPLEVDEFGRAIPPERAKTLFESVKQDAKKIVSDAKESAKTLTDGTVVRECDAHRLSYLLGDVAEARGQIAVLVRLFPNDKEIKALWDDAVKAHETGYKGRDNFVRECLCKKK